MGTLKFFTGTMGSAKTATLLLDRDDAIRHGGNVITMKSALDTRDGKNVLASRSGLIAFVDEYKEKDNLIELFKPRFAKTDIIYIDEVELITPEQAEQLKKISVDYNIEVKAYGLRTNFKLEPFPGSSMIWSLAECSETLMNRCPCGKNWAIVNARYNYQTGDIEYDGPVIEIGGAGRYVGLCYSCWKKGNITNLLERMKTNNELVEQDRQLAKKLHSERFMS